MSNMNLCLYCKNKTMNPKYCSRSCSAKVSNKTSKRKRKVFLCFTCGLECGYRRKFCDSCTLGRIDYTLREAIYSHHYKSSAFALVRTRARLSDKARSIKSCQHCGYSKHVEVCHIKPINSFSLDTRLSEINAEDNLIVLCPNCHWEYDHR